MPNTINMGIAATAPTATSRTEQRTNYVTALDTKQIALEEDSTKRLVRGTLDLQRAAFQQNPYPSLKDRLNLISQIWACIDQNELALQEAISDDFGHRSAVETNLAEINVIRASVSHTSRHLKRWMRNRKVPTALQYKPAKNRIIAQPRGVVGIISPWNYPLQLTVLPLLGALAAGNRVMVKPSELTPAFAKLFHEIVSKYFDEDQISVITGGADVAAEFSTLPFDHLVFTGSTQIGKLVAKATAENLTPVTLELGGKSPVLVDSSADINKVIPRLVFGKLLNAGQTCIAPDYVLMPAAQSESFAKRLVGQAESYYPTVAGNSDYTSIVSDKHYARLQALIQDAEYKGAKIYTAGSDDPRTLAQQRKVPLTVITNTTSDMRIVQEEIFGPLLPIVDSENLEASLNYVQKHDRPLALYLFAQDAATIDTVLRRSISGGVSVNDTLMHVAQEDLPFGGIGPSGMGAYHGEHGFTQFSHMKAVLFQSRFSGVKILYPPYTQRTKSILSFLKRVT